MRIYFGHTRHTVNNFSKFTIDSNARFLNTIHKQNLQ